MNKATNTVTKIIIIVLLFIFVGVGGYGIYTYQHREIDTTDYTVVDSEETDFEYDEEIIYEYVDDEISFSSDVQEKLDEMTIEEKVAQLFVLSQDEIEDTSFFEQYPIGGIVSFNNDTTLMEEIEDESIDSLGISLLKIAGDYQTIADRYSRYDETIYSIGSSGDDDINRDYISDIAYGAELLGFNMVVSPNCNISTTNEEDSYGPDSISNSDMLETAISEYKEYDIWMIGNTYPYKNQRETTIETLQQEDLIEFQCAIDNNIEAIMLSDAICRPITESASIPVFLSENTLDYLRARMGFDGLVFTPDLYDYRNTEYTYSEMCIKAINSGVDILYNPSNFTEVYQDVLNAVNNGQISQTRLNNSVGRILSLKLN